MRKALVVAVGALAAAACFAPAAQARHRKAKPAPMMMMAPMNPRIAPNGDFYATPVQAGDPTAVILTPLGVPGAVVGGVAQPALALPGDVVGGVGGIVQPVLAVPGAVVGGVTQPIVGGTLPGIDLLPR